MTKGKGATGGGGGEQEELSDELLPASLFIIYSLFATPDGLQRSRTLVALTISKDRRWLQEEEEACSRPRMSLVFS